MMNQRDKFLCQGCNQPKSVGLLMMVRGREYCMWCIQDAGVSYPTAKVAS